MIHKSLSRAASALTLALAAGTAMAQQGPQTAPSMPMHGPMHGAMQGNCSGDRGGPARDGRDMRQRMLAHLLDDVKATPDQRARITAIAHDAAAHGRALHDQMRDLGRRHLELLAAPTIDRAALEQLQTKRAALMDRMSREENRTEIAIAEALTPAQRQQALSTLKQHEQGMRQRWEHRDGASAPAPAN